jgi:hypothetical protein
MPVAEVLKPPRRLPADRDGIRNRFACVYTALRAVLLGLAAWGIEAEGDVGAGPVAGR